MVAYQQMATVYDHLMDEAPYDEWVNFTEKTLPSSATSNRRIIDLGCGTGEIAIRLAKKGYQLIGVDYSSDMLTIAEQKASEENLSIRWLHQDLKELDGFKDLDVAISYCDVMNYITSTEELLTVFQRVYELLKEGGSFLFDIHSLYHVEHHLVNQTFADETDEGAYIWFCSSGEHKGEMYHDLTFFTREGNLYRRFDESHHQRTYSVHTYLQLLEQVGFTDIQLFGDFSAHKNSYHEETERFFFKAVKESRK